MSQTGPTAHDIQDAAAALVQAFANNDESAYFDAFAPECTFVFYTDDAIHLSRESWHTAWRALRDTGWAVQSCRSLESHITLLAEGGIFVHVLETTAGTPDALETYRERETIVFERRDGQLLAVHEHLSPLPTQEVSE